VFDRAHREGKQSAPHLLAVAFKKALAECKSESHLLQISPARFSGCHGFWAFFASWRSAIDRFFRLARPTSLSHVVGVPPMKPRRFATFFRQPFAARALGIVLLLASMSSAFATELLVCDGGHGAIRRFDASSGAYLGDLVSDSNLFLTALTFDNSGYLYVSCANSNSVRRYNAKTGVFLGTFAAINQPYDLAFGPDNNLYVTSAQDYSVHRFDGVTGASLGIFAPPPNGAVGPPGGLVFHNQFLFVTYLQGTNTGGTLWKFDATTGASLGPIYTNFFGNGPRQPRFGPDGNLYVPEWQTFNLDKFDGASLALTTNFSVLQGPISLCFGDDGNLIVLFDDGSQSRVERYNPQTGALLGQLIAPGAGGIGRASVIMVRSPASQTLFHFRFEGTPGTPIVVVNDSSPNFNSGYVTGAGNYTRGLSGSAVDLSGDSNYVSVANLPEFTADSWTIEFFFRANQPYAPYGTNPFVLANKLYTTSPAGNNPSTFELGYSTNGQVYGYVGLLGDDVIKITAGPGRLANDGHWHHLALVSTNMAGVSNQLSLYLDYLLVGTTNFSRSQIIGWANFPLSIGAGNLSGQDTGPLRKNFDGQIDECRLVTAPLSPSQFLTLPFLLTTNLAISTLDAGHTRLAITSDTNKIYQLQSCPDLSGGGHWTNVNGYFFGSPTPIFFTNSLTPQTPHEFFRILRTP
jgi:sugar lactone lactonase YvrE